MKTGLLQGPGRANLHETTRSNDPLFSIETGILCLLLIFVLVPGSVQAVTIIWTTTADFDTGTYTSSAGNREINSNSCNLGIATGSFELDSLKGDSFCIADADGDTFKWDICERGGLTGSAEITGGQMVLTIPNVAGSDQIAFRSSSTFSGNSLDFRLKQTPVQTNAIEEWWQILNEQICTFQDSATNDGVLYQVLGQGASFTLTAFTIQNGGATVCGTATSLTDSPVWRRIVRTGASSWEFYYSADGSSFTLDESCTQSVTGSLYSSSEIGDNAQAVAITADFDDFRVVTGTIDTGGFRTSGSWTSATQTFDGTVASQITVTYSGASAVGYIDAIRIVDSVGTMIFTDDTDRTSGSSVVVTVTYSAALQDNWAVRILLAGDGSATATVESITVDTVPPPGSDEPPARGFPGFGLDCRSELAQIRCILTLPQTAGLQILQTQWYMDGSFRGYGIALDESRQQVSLGAPLALSIYRGSVNVTVLVLVSNGQEIRQSEILSVDNSWITFLLILGSVVGVCLILLRMMGKLEIRRKRIEKRKGKPKENWRWQLFEK